MVKGALQVVKRDLRWDSIENIPITEKQKEILDSLANKVIDLAHSTKKKHPDFPPPLFMMAVISTASLIAYKYFSEEDRCTQFLKDCLDHVKEVHRDVNASS